VEKCRQSSPNGFLIVFIQIGELLFDDFAHPEILEAIAATPLRYFHRSHFLAIRLRLLTQSPAPDRSCQYSGGDRAEVDSDHRLKQYTLLPDPYRLR